MNTERRKFCNECLYYKKISGIDFCDFPENKIYKIVPANPIQDEHEEFTGMHKYSPRELNSSNSCPWFQPIEELQPQERMPEW
jgi:hypothetical protein